jgi:hypothetical protein
MTSDTGEWDVEGSRLACISGGREVDVDAAKI